MLDKTLQPLLESGIINESTKQALTEAWEIKLNEAREEIRAELRDEFAHKHEHDKLQMVEALDKMVTESLQAEIIEFAKDKESLREDRVRAKQKMLESADNFSNFMIQKLAEEIKELRADRMSQESHSKKLEKFVVEALAKEIGEFSQDKRAAIDAKVKLVSEGRKQIEQLKKQWIAENSKKVSQVIASHLQGELQQLKEDIKVARENNFGRRLFEAFASEFSVTHLNEKAETRKLLKQISEQDSKLVEAQQKLVHAQKLIEKKETEVRIVKESNIREKVMTELLSTLNEDRASVMRSLLESVQTPKLKDAFDKYLPSVLNGGAARRAVPKQPLQESRTIVTGNKSAERSEKPVDPEYRDNVVDLKRLAGL